ncbi:hypothetical protein AAVH_34632, partial [Aphelenchoides avenae]
MPDRVLCSSYFCLAISADVNVLLIILIKMFTNANDVSGCFRSMLLLTAGRHAIWEVLPETLPTHADVSPFMISVAHKSFYGAPADVYYFENKRLKELMTIVNFKHQLS